MVLFHAHTTLPATAVLLWLVRVRGTVSRRLRKLTGGGGAEIARPDNAAPY